MCPPFFLLRGNPGSAKLVLGRLRLRDSSSVCAASEGGAPFVARRAIRLHGCAFPHFAPPPAATPPGSPVAGALHAVFSIRCRIRALKHLTLSTWFGELRDLLPAASPDLSSSAVALWPALAFAVCPRCGAFEGPGPGPHPSPCGLCAAAPPPFDAARSLFSYAGDVRHAIVATKYAGRPYPVDAVARRLHETLVGGWRDLIPDGAPPTVVPVPAHPWKYFRRGFNLPALIASRLSQRIGLPFDPLALSRTRGRVPQARLPGILRHENVEGAFRVPRGRKVPPAILLLDDVYTSGATAEACARALKCAGADSIVVVTVARTVS